MSGDPRIAIADGPAELARMAAELIVDAADASPECFPIALSGGTTPRPLYELLASAECRDRIPWSLTHIFFADERCVPPTHPESNFGMIDERLLSRVPLPSGNVHRMVGEARRPANAAQEYEWRLTAVCPLNGGSDAPALDLVVLGMGDDGHAASLFPETEALAVTGRWVVANRVPRLATTRLTLTYPALAAARKLIFLVAGEGKADIVARVLSGDTSLPATRALAESPSATLLLDRDAASALG